MKLPTLRLTLSDLDFEMAKPALLMLRSGLTSYCTNRFTPREFWKAVDGRQAKKLPYKKQRFSQKHADFVLSAVSKLLNRGASRKVRLNVFEISALALALRLTKRMVSTKATIKKKPIAALEKRLENLRRQARRMALRSIERVELEYEGARWRMFCDWTRANLFFQVPDTRWFDVRKFCADQREALAEMISETLEERRYQPLAGNELKRVARLLWESFRRHRRHYTMREFLSADKAEAKLYLFELLKKRAEVIPTSQAEKNWCVLAAERNERFRNRSYRKPAANQNVPIPPAEATPPATPPRVQVDLAVPESIGSSSNPARVRAEPKPQLPDEVAESVAKWFSTEVPISYWSEFDYLANGILPMTPPPGLLLRDGMPLPAFWDRTQPPPLNRFLPPAAIAHHATTRLMNWVTRFLYGIYGFHRADEVVAALKKGFEMAKESILLSTEAA